MLINYRKALPP